MLRTSCAFSNLGIKRNNALHFWGRINDFGSIRCLDKLPVFGL
jgi:hypothetical protein